MEEDTGKSLHVGGATGRIHGADYSLVDYNRAGIPLIEIVTKPIMGAGEKAPEVARAYVAQLRELLARRSASPTSGWSRARCAATSTSRSRPTGGGTLGTRTETKNVNSLRSVERAVRYEMQRQAAILERRRLDPAGDPALARGHRRSPRSGREKSDAEDYRYFPEPDLVPGRARAASGSRSCAARCPSRRRVRRARLQADWGFTDLEMRDIVGAGALDLVEETIAAGATPAGRAQVVARRAGPARQRGRRRASPTCRSPRPTSPRVQALVDDGHAQRQAGPPGLRRRARRRGHARTRSSPPAASRSSPTTAPSAPRSTRPSPPTPTSPTRSATARSPPPAR